MKRFLMLLLVAAMILSMIACGKTPEPTPVETQEPAPTEAPQEVVGMPNPITTVATYAELCQISPEVQIADAPEGASNVVYSWIRNIPVIKQVDFSYNGHEFTLRAIANPTGVITTDISGVWDPMDATSSVAVGSENAAGGTYILQYNTEKGSGIASWVSTLNNCQYSLYTPTGCKDFVINKVVESVYTCTANAQQVTGTVQMVTNKTLTLALTNGDTAVLDCSAISNVTVQPSDVVTVDYLGDLKGAAQALKIVRTGHDETQQISGVVQVADGSDIFVKTADGNVYLFHLTGKTKISGVANHVTKNDEVKVSYEGKLGWEDTYALEIVVVKVNSDVKPDPTPNYTNHTASGYVTSVAGKYICVNGITFYIDTSVCTVSGSMKVDSWADLSYRKYNNGNIEVYKATFTNKDPERKYTLRTIYGTITSLKESSSNGFYKMVIDDHTFVVHYNVISEGTPRVGDDADLHYKDYGKETYEVTEARFYKNDPGWKWEQVYGTITKVSGNYVTIKHKEYFVPSSTIYEGTPVVGGEATLYLKVYNNGDKIVDEAHFFPPEPDPITYEDINIRGTINSISGNTMRVQGMSIEIPSHYSGTPIVGGTVDLVQRSYSDGKVEIISCIFYAPVEPDYYDENMSGTIDSISNGQMRVEGMNITIPDHYSGCDPEEGGTVDLTRRIYNDGRVDVIRCVFYPAPKPLIAEDDSNARSKKSEEEKREEKHEEEPVEPDDSGDAEETENNED